MNLNQSSQRNNRYFIWYVLLPCIISAAWICFSQVLESIIPCASEMNRLTKECNNNLEFGRTYVGAKLLAMSMRGFYWEHYPMYPLISLQAVWFNKLFQEGNRFSILFCKWKIKMVQLTSKKTFDTAKLMCLLVALLWNLKYFLNVEKFWEQWNNLFIDWSILLQY